MRKKITLYAFILVGLFAFSSCVQEYTCKCTMTYSGQVGLPEPTTRDYPIKDTKKGAISKCEANSTTYTEGSITTVEDCEIW